MEHVTEELELEDIQIDDDMPTTAQLEARLIEAEKTLGKRLDDLEKKEPEKPQPSEWRKPAVIVSILATSITLLATVFNVVYLAGFSNGSLGSKIDGLNAKIDTIGVEAKRANDDVRLLLGRVSYIEGLLSSGKALVQPKEVLAELKAADRATFAQLLPALGMAARQPVSLVRPDAETLRAIAKKLQIADSRSAGYWPAAIEFLRFSTDFFAPNAPRPNSKRYAGIPLSGAVIEGVTFDVANNYSFNDLTFKDCRIILRDLSSIEFHNVTFINCVFEIPVADQPSPQLQRFTQKLLASNLSTITITGNI